MIASSKICYTFVVMNYDGLTLAAVVAEMNRILPGSRAQKIRQHNDTDITIEMRGTGRSFLLFMSADARFTRVYLTSSSAQVPPQPPDFCMVLRKYLEGRFLTRIEQVQMDRIIKLHFEARTIEPVVLIMEIMGKHSNLILVDHNEKILGAAKHVGTSVSRFRQILPGRQYTPPPSSDKVDIRSVDLDMLKMLWDTKPHESLRDWLLNTFSGFGPFLANEISLRSTEDSEVCMQSLFDELQGLSEMARTQAYLPVFITDEKGRGIMAYPMPSVQFPAQQQHARASINETLDSLFRTLVSRTVLEEERMQLSTAIRRAIASRKQTIKSIERTIAESDKADRYRQIGELLIANLNNIEKGKASITLTDFFDPELSEIVVEIDEKLTPQQNAERYFKRYQKSRDSVSTAKSRKAVITANLSDLETALEDAEKETSVESLKALRKSLLDKDLLRQEISQEKQTAEFEGHRIKRHFTPEGWEILYGENSTSNDYLTQRIAKPNDVWLHARSITGAHVIIRTSGHSGSVPRTVLNKAALIAAQTSDAKHSSLVPIDHTLRKYVRKPRGSAPGFVVYKNEKTIDINPKADNK